MKYFEDFVVGSTLDCGTRRVGKEEIIAFAREFDPQPFHIDEAAAAKSHFGGVIASGWHSGSICMRLVVDAVLHDSASMGSPGIDKLRWLKPLRAGTTVRAKVKVLDKAPSASRPDRGRMSVMFELHDEDRGELLMDLTATVLMGRRPA
jgi:acyl dehydratase